MTQLRDDDFIENRPEESAHRNKKSGTPSWVIPTIVLAGAALFVCPCLIALLLPAVHQAREAARRTQASNSMKQIGLAMHNFEAINGHFPPSDVDQETPVQSWMTDILPYMEQQSLYNGISRQLSWDDTSNKASFSVVIPEYQNPSVRDATVDANGYALAHFAANSQVIFEDRGMKIADIADGLSNTFLAGMVDAGFKPWGDPSNHRDPAAGAGGGPQAFGSPHVGVVYVLMADGSVQSISKEVDPQVFKQLGDPMDRIRAPNGAFEVK